MLKQGTRKKTKRLTGPQRKRQIVEVILDLVAEHGVRGTTTARIAAAAGVSQAALYMHFATREEMLRAAIDLLYDRVSTVITSSAEPDIIERLRKIGRFHSGHIASESNGFLHPLFEFLAAPPDVGLRETLGAKQRLVINDLAAIIEEGKIQGTVRSDVDAEQVAWELHGVYWAEDVSHLMSLTDFVTSGRSAIMLERILSSIATQSDSK